ncbi:MAG: hypothetical protein FADNKDHG_01562 [Holosporales bacterium]
MRQTESIRLIPAKKGVLLFAILLLFMANALKAQYIEDVDDHLQIWVTVDDSARIVNRYRLFITQPTNNSDSIIDVVESYDSVTINRKLNLLLSYFQKEERMRYCFTDSNTKFIEEIYQYVEANDQSADGKRCTTIKNPYHLKNLPNNYFGTKLLAYYHGSPYDNKSIVKYDKATKTTFSIYHHSRRFPDIEVIYYNEKLFYIDFYEVIR